MWTAQPQVVCRNLWRAVGIEDCMGESILKFYDYIFIFLRLSCVVEREYSALSFLLSLTSSYLKHTNSGRGLVDVKVAWMFSYQKSLLYKDCFWITSSHISYMVWHFVGHNTSSGLWPGRTRISPKVYYAFHIGICWIAKRSWSFCFANDILCMCYDRVYH